MLRLLLTSLALVFCLSQSYIHADSIIAVVDNVIISSNEYNERIKLEQFLSRQSSKHKQERSDKEILQDLLLEKIVQKNAKAIGMVISTEMVHNAVQSIEKGNNMEIGNLRRVLENSSISYQTYQDMIAAQITIQHIEAQLFQQNITITSQDIDNEIITTQLSDNTQVKYIVIEADKNDVSYNVLLKVQKKMPSCDANIVEGKGIQIHSLASSLNSLPVLDKSILSSADTNLPTMIVQSEDKYKFFILCSRDIGSVSAETKNTLWNSIAKEKIMLERQKLLDHWYDNATIEILNRSSP